MRFLQAVKFKKSEPITNRNRIGLLSEIFEMLSYLTKGK